MKKHIRFKETIIKSFNIILRILVSISFAFFSLYMIVGQTNITFIILTPIISFSCAYWFCTKTYKKLMNRIKKNIMFSLIILFFIEIMLLQFFELAYLQVKYINSFIGVNNNITSILIIPSVIYLSLYLSFEIREMIIVFYKNMNAWDKKAYIISSIICLIIVCVLYNVSPSFYLQYDKIYSLDSGWIYKDVLSNPFHYLIQHPLMGCFYFPIYSIGNMLCLDFLKPIFFQFINTQLILMIALELKQLTRKKQVFYLFMVSFPTLLLTVFYEKYAFCVFLLVTYMYCSNIIKKGSNETLVVATCVMPTNAFLGISEIFRTKKADGIIYKCLIILAELSLILICFGRMSALFYWARESFSQLFMFARPNFGLIESIVSSIKAIEGALIGLPSVALDDRFLWVDLTSGISFFAVFIIVVILFAIILIFRNKDSIYKTFVLWYLFAFVLFVGIKWSIHESPLFSFYFSWAIIPLFVYGIDNILRLLRIKQKYHKYVYLGLILIIFIINVSVLYGAYNYALTIHDYNY